MDAAEEEEKQKSAGDTAAESQKSPITADTSATTKKARQPQVYMRIMES